MSSDSDRAPLPGAPWHERLSELLDRLVTLPPEQRESFLATACGDDPACGEELRSLLQAHESAGEYFARLSEDVAAPFLSATAPPAADAEAADMLMQLRADLAPLYRIERQLGGAGMSRVFVAEEIRLKRHVVIKVLDPERLPTVNAERFRHEIELAAQLQHPHIVTLLTADTVNGTLYYTMPLVAGESLKELIARDGPLPASDAMRIWRDVLDALAHAHAEGVIHRDIKPGNILLSGRHALVTDFGIAVAIETAGGGAGESQLDLALGTPAYMAPELVRNPAAIDHRVDLYSAGVVAYEMLAGRPPFTGGSPRDLVHAHLVLEPPPLQRPDALPMLVALVIRCLAKDPADRPPTAEAILAELDTIASAAPVSAARPPAAAAHPARRRVLGYGLAALALGMATIVGVSLTRPDRAGASGARGYTPPVEAYEWYQRGMDPALLRTHSGRLKGVEYFQRAIALDSTFAAAYAGLARMYGQLAFAAPDEERAAWQRRAAEAVQRSLALGDSIPEALAALAWLRLLERRYASAEAAMRRVTAMNANVPRVHEGLARIYMMTGRKAEQLAEARLGVELDPWSHSARRELALALVMNYRCDEAIALLRPLKRLTPPAGVAGLITGQCHESAERWGEAIAEYRWAMQYSATSARAFLGHALARAGEVGEARRILSDLESGRSYSHGAFGIAIVYAGFRDYDQSFSWLERAADRGQVNHYIMEPMFADLHRDPRFEHLMRRIGAVSPRESRVPGGGKARSEDERIAPRDKRH